MAFIVEIILCHFLWCLQMLLMTEIWLEENCEWNENCKIYQKNSNELISSTCSAIVWTGPVRCHVCSRFPWGGSKWRWMHAGWELRNKHPIIVPVVECESSWYLDVINSFTAAINAFVLFWCFMIHQRLSFCSQSLDTCKKHFILPMFWLVFEKTFYSQ